MIINSRLYVLVTKENEDVVINYYRLDDRQGSRHTLPITDGDLILSEAPDSLISLECDMVIGTPIDTDPKIGTLFSVSHKLIEAIEIIRPGVVVTNAYDEGNLCDIKNVLIGYITGLKNKSAE